MNKDDLNINVAVTRQEASNYPEEKPYHPFIKYPEYLLDAVSHSVNCSYDMVREGLKVLGLDKKHLNTDKWNPLGSLINPGESVFLKPNLIAESAENDRDSWKYIVTHGSVIRAVVDYVYKALNGEGRIVIGDGPQTDSKINLILERTGIPAIQDFYWKKAKFEIEFLDLRNEYWIEKQGVIIDRIKLSGDPRGTMKIDLGENSYFAEVDTLNRKYYGAFYDIEETNRHHTMGIHEYLICRTPIEANVFINIPKLKTHGKVGLTVNLKNLVGINGNKNWLPHFSFGSPRENGDQFDKSGAKNRLENKITLSGKKLLLKNRIMRLIATKSTSIGYKIFGGTEKVVRSGNWYGNDTCWRMSLDLNKILLYGNSDGTLEKNFNRKRYFSVVDGIIGMEGNGPVAGFPISTGLIIIGFDPLNVDLVCAKLMGFDYQKIRLLARSFDDGRYKIHQNTYSDICVVSNVLQWDKPLFEISPETCYKFKPHFGWRNHIEI